MLNKKGWNVDNLACNFIKVIETSYKTNNYNIFLVGIEIPALVSILKRFTIYLLVFFLLLTSFIWGIYILYKINIDCCNSNLFSLDQFFYISNNIGSINLLVDDYYFLIYLKYLIVIHLILNICLFCFYYLNSFFLLQKYNSINKFRGNDLIPDSLDFEFDGIKKVMWKI